MRRFLILALGVALAAVGQAADGAAGDGDAEAASTAQPEAAAAAAAEPQPATATSSDRTRLNLLGEVDSESGEARRNENVRLTLIDNNVLKELNQRMGATATVHTEFQVERNYFGKEFGGNAQGPLHLGPVKASGVHGEIFWSHNNSIFSARSFFQVGDVQPAKTNDYGGKITAPLGKKTALTIDASQRRLRGQVNGNVLVPAADERVPTTTDPAKLAIVNAVLAAYGDELPNRTDINPRALNTNAPQNIDNDRIAATLDHALTDDDRVTARYSVTLQNVEAFQLTGGQNPDTTTKNHSARLSWSRAWNPSTTTDFSLGYDRIGSLLVPEETSLGPFYLFGRILNSIGPGGNIPIDRAQNMFRYAGRLRKTANRHEWTTGFAMLRRQINGFESNNHRGTFSFRRDFGRDHVGNLHELTPSQYRVAIGSAHRGFRNWDLQFFLQDKIQATSKLTLTLGLRYEPVTRPSEINALSEIPYDCDCNNFAPRFGFAYNLSDKWGVLRGAYGIHYGEIFPATFMQTRFNTPGILSLSLLAPDVLDPLGDLTPDQLSPDARSDLNRLDTELASPYSHQYNLTWELRPYKDWVVELAYLGSRSPKLLSLWYLNRGRNVPGIPLTTRTINERRADQRYFNILHAVNGSFGYYDAAKATLRIPRWRGLSLETSYWYSKAIDLGSNYTNTAFGRDGRNGRSPSEFDVHGLMKGLSDFDQPHAVIWRLNYETPRPGPAGSLIAKLLGRWQVSSIVLLKSGTPFNVRSGDAPGFGNIDGAGSDRPNLLDPSILGNVVDDPDTAALKIPRSAFAFINPGDETGNLGRNVFRKDGVFNVNMAVSRRFTLGGDKSLLLRAESLNFTNHPQFEEPGIDLTGANFGQITNTLNDGRTFRFTLRFVF